MLFISFPLFPPFSLRQIITNFQARLLTSERCCSCQNIVYGLLECSNGSNQVGDHTGIC